VLGPDYYRRGLELIRDRGHAPTVFVFSDDTPWCADHLDLPDGATVVDVPGRKGWEDMLLIAACRHQVIANSSFSWWGAWLADPARGGVTVAPHHWAIDPSADFSDIAPPGWLRA
jgi:hypothetical protein